MVAVFGLSYGAQMGRSAMNVQPNQQRGHRKAVINYETVYRKHQRIFKQAGLWSIGFLILFFVALDNVITHWLTVGKFDLIVFLFLGLLIICALGLIDKLPTMAKAHMASKEHSIMMVLNCKKIFNSYRAQLASVGYDRVSLERLSDQGIAPQEFERIIRDILATRKREKPQPKLTAQNLPAKRTHVSEPKAAQFFESQKDSILLSLREKEHEIKTRVRKGTLSKPEANVKIESVRREAKKKLQELGISEV